MAARNGEFAESEDVMGIRRAFGALAGMLTRFRTVVVLVPCPRIGRKDGVAALLPFRGRLTPFGVRSIVVRGDCASFDEEVRRARIVRERLRLLLIAHPAMSREGICVGAGQYGSGTLLNASWFDGNVKCDLLIAFVCNGARVLGRPEWEARFPVWVSHEGPLGAYVDSETGVRRWSNVFRDLSIIAAQARSRDVAEARVKAVYLLAIADIGEDYDSEGGDDINVALLQQAFESTCANGG